MLTEKDMIWVEPNSERWLSLEDLPCEEWRDIKDFEGLYEISNYGRVKSLSRYRQLYSKLVPVEEKIRRVGYDKDGYCVLPLNNNSKKYMIKIHRLVGEHFLGEHIDKNVINHKNCIRHDNRVFNLEWVTPIENFDYCKGLGRNYHPTKGKHGIDNPHSKKIIVTNKKGDYIGTFYSALECEHHFGVDKRHVTAICRKERKSGGGYIFTYANNIE